MFEGYHVALDFFRSLESTAAIVDFVCKHSSELAGYEVSVAGLALAEKSRTSR